MDNLNCIICFNALESNGICKTIEIRYLQQLYFDIITYYIQIYITAYFRRGEPLVGQVPTFCDRLKEQFTRPTPPQKGMYIVCH